MFGVNVISTRKDPMGAEPWFVNPACFGTTSAMIGSVNGHRSNSMMTRTTGTNRRWIRHPSAAVPGAVDRVARKMTIRSIRHGDLPFIPTPPPTTAQRNRRGVRSPSFIVHPDNEEVFRDDGCEVPQTDFDFHSARRLEGAAMGSGSTADSHHRALSTLDGTGNESAARPSARDSAAPYGL